ncbi:MAG: PQQ-binding-like beta-propeller repeat protein [Planctomycetes bacterium]|nr:PQQ-binding-like beta-propeller repeat protein [Planctomycetota bacterium]
MTRWHDALELGVRLGVLPEAGAAAARAAIEQAHGAQVTPSRLSEAADVATPLLEGLLRLADAALPGGPPPAPAELAVLAETLGVKLDAVASLLSNHRTAPAACPPARYPSDAAPTLRAPSPDTDHPTVEPTLIPDPAEASPTEAFPPDSSHRLTIPAKGTPAPGVPPTKRLGPYELLDVLGHGGMGLVYRARHVTLGTLCAVKVLIAGQHASSEAIGRFEREAAAVAKMGKHPNIVTVHDLGREGAVAYYAMELVEGASLARRMRERGFAPIEASALLEKVARAIHFAHSHGIIHRDIKPDNIVVGEDGEPQVMDFGLALDVGSEHRLTRTGQIMGTPAYMAPEQAGGDTAGIDARTDVYALGAVLYELLTGIPPHRGEALAELLLRVLRGEIVAPRKLRPDVPRDVETICLKALSTDPRGRYATAERLADDLGRFVRGEPVLARPVGPAARALRHVRRRPLVSALVAGLAVIAAGLAWRLVGPARIALATDPPGARVEAVGRTMWRRWVWPAGAFELQISAPGRETKVVHADAGAGATCDLGRVELESDHGFLTLDSRPSGAELRIDLERVRARTPIRELPVPNGDHTLTLRLEGHEEYATALAIRPGGTLRLGAATLQHEKGELRLTGNPRGMELTLREADSGRVVMQLTPPLTLPFDTGTYLLEGRAVDSFFRSVKVRVHHDRPTSANLGLPRQVTWSSESLQEISRQVLLGDLDGDGVLDVAGVMESTLFAMSGRTRSQLWAVSPGKAGVGTPAFADMDRDGILDVVAGTWDGKVLAISGRAGTLAWMGKSRLPAPVQTRPALADLDGDGVCDVVVGCGDGNVYAFPGADGGQLWCLKTGKQVNASPVLADLDGDGRLECVVGSTDKNVYVASGDKGSVLWSFATGGGISETPGVADLDGDGVLDVVVAPHDRRLYALSGRKGTPLWTHELEQDAYSLAVSDDVDGDGTPDWVVTTADKWSPGRVLCLSGRQGNELWRADSAAQSRVCGAARDLDGDMVGDPVVGCEHRILALSGRDGRPLWSYPINRALAAPTLGDVEGDRSWDCVLPFGYEAEPASELRCLSASATRLLWTARLPDRAATTPTLADLDGDGVPDCVVGGGDCKIHALSGRDGFELWTLTTQTNIFSRAVPVDLDRDGVTDFLVNALDHRVYALSGRTGNVLWKRAVGNTDQVVTGGGSTLSAPAVLELDGDGVPDCIVGSEDSAVYALSGRDGSVLWRTETGGKVDSSPALADLDGDGVLDAVIGSGDGRVYALSGKTGRVLWSQETGDPADCAVHRTVDANGDVHEKRVSGHPVFSSPALARLRGDGVPDVLIGSTADAMLALSGRDGTVLWTTRTNGGFIGTPATTDINNDGVPDCIAGSTNGVVYALSGKDGARLWTARAGNCVHADAVLADADGDGVLDCLVGSIDSNLYALSGRDGRLLWSFRTGDRVESAVALADLDGDRLPDVVLGSWDGSVVALRGRDPKAVARADADWSDPAEAQARLARHRLVRAWKALAGLAEECARSTKDPWLRAVALSERGIGLARLSRAAEALDALAEARRLGLRSRLATVCEWFAASAWKECGAERLAAAKKAVLELLEADADGVFDAFGDFLDLAPGARAALVFREYLERPSKDDRIQTVASVLLSLRQSDGSRPGLETGAESASAPGATPGSPSASPSPSPKDALGAARKRVRRHLASADAPIARWFGYLALLDDALGYAEGADAAREAFRACAERPASVERLLEAAAGRR